MRFLLLACLGLIVLGTTTRSFPITYTRSMPSLTSHLLHLDENALKEATNHPFLFAAANQSLPLEKLKAWLGQDRLYQMAYINFIGIMLSKIGVPNGSDRESTLEWQAADLLIDTLTNIRWEMKMFEDTAQGEGWLEDISNLQPSIETRAYQDLFAGATAQGRPLIVGLTVLWATEECYLRAWRYSMSKMAPSVREEDKDVMQKTFIPNWSSSEFETFVKRIGGVVDNFGGSVEEGSYEWKECEIAFKQVVWAEREFWPKMDG